MRGGWLQAFDHAHGGMLFINDLRQFDSPLHWGAYVICGLPLRPRKLINHKDVITLRQAIPLAVPMLDLDVGSNRCSFKCSQEDTEEAKCSQKEAAEEKSSE